MNEDTEITRHVWAVIASIAGALTSLSFEQWEGMTKGKIFLALFVAASFGFFVSPIVLVKVHDVQVAGAVIWVMAAGSNILIPRAVKLMSGLMDRVFGTNSETK